MLPALPPYRVIDRAGDRFGAHRRSTAKPPVNSAANSLTWMVPRHFRLVLTTQAAGRRSPAAGHFRRIKPSAFPDTPATEYGWDNGIRLSAVWLTHDPEYPENLPAAPLVRYGWTPRGELAAVYDRSNTQVRSFTYDDKYRGRMVAHRHTGRPEICYRYDSDGG